MAGTTLTQDQANLLKKQRSAGSGSAWSASLKRHRHPLTQKALRWSMGRVESSKLLIWWVNPSECQWKMTRQFF
jgi:hypothetical protein